MAHLNSQLFVKLATVNGRMFFIFFFFITCQFDIYFESGPSDRTSVLTSDHRRVGRRRFTAEPAPIGGPP